MAIVQISKIQVRSGNIADLPQLAVGEFGWAVDTQQLFIGNDPNTIGPLPDNTEILTEYSGGILTPGGTDGDIQYNDNGAFGGSGNNKWDNANSTQTIIGQMVANTVTASQSFFLAPQSITENLTLTNFVNGMSPGPVVVQTGVTITVDPGSRWTVV